MHQNFKLAFKDLDVDDRDALTHAPPESQQQGEMKACGQETDLGSLGETVFLLVKTPNRSLI